MGEAKIAILSVVAIVLGLGIVVCITINPAAAVGLAPVLAAIAAIIYAIRGDDPHEPDREKQDQASGKAGQLVEGPGPVETQVEKIPDI